MSVIVLLLATLCVTSPSEPASPPSPPAVTRPWLGVLLVRGDSGELRVERVSRRSPAARAELRPGDRLIAIANDAVDYLPGMLLDYAPGDELQLTIERDGRCRQLEVTLEAWPDGVEPPPLPIYRKRTSTPGDPSPNDRQEA